MASTYSTLKIELITTGEQSGTWGTTTNTNLGTAIEEMVAGRATATFTTDADLTISLTDTNATQTARNYILNVVSSVSLTATRSLIVPTVNKPYIIENNTTGGQSITVKTAAGTGITVGNGVKKIVYADGTNVVIPNDIGLLTHEATSKTTPVDADEMPLSDSAASYGLKKLTWANLKATLKTYFDTLYSTVSLSGNNTWTGTQTFRDNKFVITDDSDTTKQLNFQCSPITTGTTRVVSVQDADLSMAGTNVVQSYTKAQRGAVVTLTDGATITPDFSAANNFTVQLGGNRSLATPTSLAAGQSGQISINQDGTGSRTLSYGWGWQWAGGTAPVLSTAAWTRDVLCYSVDVYVSGTCTISIASPGVITYNAHGLIGNQKVQFTTTGALPTGLTASTTYYVVGSSIATNTFQVSATAGGAAINTSGTQSGVHTLSAVSITGSLIKAIT